MYKFLRIPLHPFGGTSEELNSRMLKRNMWEILHISIDIFAALFDLFCNIRITNQAWLQSQQMQKHSHGTLSLDRLLHIHVFYGHTFFVGVQKDIGLDHYINSPSLVSLDEIRRYQCQTIPIKM